jgi:trans-aconitate methyltransferase
MLAGLEEHLARLSGLPRLTSILDVGCGSGSMARLLAAKHPDAQVVDRPDTSRYTTLFFVRGTVPSHD